MQLTINKVAAGVVGLAMVAGLAFAFTATRAHAITLSELVELFIALEVIPDDKADEARAVLDGQDAEETPAMMMSCNFTRNLTTGDTGADVMDLQKLLNAKGFVVSVSGAGSPGMETEYFGPATKNAVAGMQEAYASEILTPLGLTAGTGYFGASTRAKANELCSATTPDVPTVPGDDDDDDTDDDNDLSGGEASLEDFDKTSSIGDEELDEGEEDVEVYGFEFDVEDADVEVSRVDIRLENTAGSVTGEDPWRVFDEISLWYDGDMIASENADDEDDWGNEAGSVWSMRFSGLDVMVDEGDTAKFVVAVSVGSIDDGDLPMTWTIWVEENGVRARDAAGINQYIGDAATPAEDETFEIQTAGGDTEFNITTANSNPDSSIIKVEKSSRTNDVPVLVMDVESEEGESTINKIVLHATSSDSDLASVISDIALDIDGTTINDWYYAATPGATSATAPAYSSYIVFNLEDEDEEYTLDADEEVEIQVLVDFKQLTGNYLAATTIEFDVDNASEAEWKVDDISGDDLGTAIGGTANGETHQLYSEGIFAEVVSVDETKTAGDSNANDVGTYEVEFDLTAFDDTFYVSATTTAAVANHIENGSGGTVTVGTTSVAVTSTAKKESGAYRIDEGDTETFTLTVTINPSAGEGSGYYRVELDSITYGDDTNAAGSLHTASPDEDFETGVLYLNA